MSVGTYRTEDMRLLQKVKSDAAHRAVWSYVAAAGGCALGLLIVAVLGAFANHAMPGVVYIPVHTILEFTSIVVSFAVFVVGWYGYRQTQNRQDLFIATAFLAVGAIDFVHTLSYKGMPNFLGTNTVGKAAAYWLAARLLGATALLAAAFVPPTTKSRLVRPGILMPAMALLIGGIVALVSMYSSKVSMLMYRPESGLTALKVRLEYVVIAIYAGAFWALGRARGWRADPVMLLRAAIILAIGSEICFTLYKNAYDAHNLLGHIYKVVAYYLVLQALFVSSLRRPYHELSYAKEQLQKSFTSIGEALGSGLHKDSTLRQIASLARQMFEADMAAIGEIKEGDVIEIGRFDGLDPGVFRVPVRESLAREAFATVQPLVIDDIRVHPRARPELVNLGLRSLMSAPIVRDGRPAGAVYVGSLEFGRFTSEDAEILTAFARHAAIAIANAEHYEREHRIAETLQQVIFPPAGLEIGPFKIAGKYQPAWDEAQVGGDFYDYFDLGDGRLGIVIGDVSGKGLDAAVHTAIVKYSYQAYLREGFGPAEALRRLGEALKERSKRGEVPDSVFITLFCAVLDTNTGRLTYSNAGHEPPIKVSASGEVLALDSTGPILGLRISKDFGESETTLQPGDMLVLYTDGITEARIGGRLFGQNRLIEAIRSCHACSPEELAEHVYELAKSYARGVIQDDVAIIAILNTDAAAT